MMKQIGRNEVYLRTGILWTTITYYGASGKVKHKRRCRRHKKFFM